MTSAVVDIRAAPARWADLQWSCDRSSPERRGRLLRCGPCLDKRRAAKPAVYFGLQRRPGLAGRQPRI